MHHPQRSLLALVLTSAASAQAPDLIQYTFDGGTAVNSAVPGVGDGTPNAGVSFGATAMCAGASSPGAISLGGSFIDSGWTPNLGGSDFTIGFWLDLRSGGNAFQYVWGISGNSGNFRGFLGTGNAVILSGGGLPTVFIPGSATTAAPHHVVFVYDSSVSAVLGYLDGAVVSTTPVTGAVNVTGTGTFQVMGFTNQLLAGNAIDDFRFYSRAISAAEVGTWMAGCGGGGGSAGTSFCGPAVANSTGSPAAIVATGSAVLASNDLGLAASSLPLNAFGFFLASRTQGFVANPGGSQGNLCLGGSIGRYVGPGQIQNSGATGSIALGVDNTQLPTPTGPVAAAAGETWNFQAWYRDAVGGSATSNFTDGVAVTLQ